MVLEGVVTNVTKFGAFVDIGVHQDGLVHISELSNRYIKDPNEAVKAGQIVKVKVLSADLVTKRIALSMKALMAPSGRPVEATTKQRPPVPVGRPRPKSQPLRTLSLDEKLAALSTRWKVQ
jgi:protein Tex